MSCINKVFKFLCVHRWCYKTDSEYLIEKMLTYNSEDECSLCLDTYDSAECITMVSCKHVFHKKCILSYIQYNNQTRDKLICPYCLTEQQY